MQKRKLLSLAGILVAIVLISASSGFSQVELFGGYSRLQFNRNIPSLGSAGANGWEGSVYLHLLGPFGAEADYSNHYGVSPRNTNGFVPGFTELYGPRFTPFHIAGIEPFAHALFGTVHGTGEAIGPLVGCPSPGCTGTTKVTDNAFGMAFGGGVNVRATRHIWIRLIQADYLRVGFTSNTQNDARLSAGIVFRFGQW